MSYWKWSPKDTGKNCVIERSLLKGVNYEKSNCFLEPSFGVNDTRKIKLLFHFDRSKYIELNRSMVSKLDVGS
jgi:hypothetical protein